MLTLYFITTSKLIDQFHILPDLTNYECCDLCNIGSFCAVFSTAGEAFDYLINNPKFKEKQEAFAICKALCEERVCIKVMEMSLGRSIITSIPISVLEIIWINYDESK